MPIAWWWLSTMQFPLLLPCAKAPVLTGWWHDFQLVKIKLYFHCNWLILKVKSKLLYDQRSVSQSVLVSSPHLGPKTRFLLLSNSCRFLDVRSKFHSTHDHILLSQIQDSPNLEGLVPVFISPRNMVAQLYPQALIFLFIASYDLQDYSQVYKPAPTQWINSLSEFSLYNFGTDHTENTISNSVSNCCSSRCLERGWVLLQVCPTITTQWIK
jgi:hypothetical protein